MSWLERVSAAPPDATTTPVPSGNAMKLGHPETFNSELREKAGMHSPPTPPEYMGFEGEYDTTGLAKRVAKQLDEDAQVEEVSTLEIIQREAVISFAGTVPNQTALDRIMDIAAHVDGTQAVDVSQVSIETEAK
ncbi:BON domain-containing protein [Pseudanabaena sp. FACHB-2040]|uniref:BON domain-containing protein n=1 Tax=Pseudanabaena sp. FACHB-2040 TaxID=2692859 RepID=UPI0016860C4F|nr:BON domain-containing protein [Pseudanabaena sp. FACHB-2040]MBD0267398.1 BON domain-containing protein [Cyanobacteria bacterium Co-bin8]MBD2256934.1 BON domain-containing protein [Pseudanabaena sp. FACHB-2040]